MNEKITAFFDAAAENWDRTNSVGRDAALTILSYARISKGKSVLDAGCGTGVLIPFYLEKEASSVAALDISPEMLRMAKKKLGDEKITYICADIEEYRSDEKYDCVMVHNAFPHFLNQEAALKSLSSLVKAGGTFTVAHSISRQQVSLCHRNIPHLSVELPDAGELAAKLADEFTDIRYLENDSIYIVTGTKKEQR